MSRVHAVLGALFGLLAPAWAGATCAAGTACADDWLWRYALPGVIVLGLVTWVIGPFLLALVQRLSSGRGDRR